VQHVGGEPPGRRDLGVQARVAALAGAGEILVSRTIRDLVAGSPIRLESHGTHELKGVPGAWEIFAVVG
jgi:class 3 adenylate cyclase